MLGLTERADSQEGGVCGIQSCFSQKVHIGNVFWFFFSPPQMLVHLWLDLSFAFYSPPPLGNLVLFHSVYLAGWQTAPGPTLHWIGKAAEPPSFPRRLRFEAHKDQRPSVTGLQLVCKMLSFHWSRELCITSLYIVWLLRLLRREMENPREGLFPSAGAALQQIFQSSPLPFKSAAEAESALPFVATCKAMTPSDALRLPSLCWARNKMAAGQARWLTSHLPRRRRNWCVCVGNERKGKLLLVKRIWQRWAKSCLVLFLKTFPNEFISR